MVLNILMRSRLAFTPSRNRTAQYNDLALTGGFTSMCVWLPDSTRVYSVVVCVVCAVSVTSRLVRYFRLGAKDGAFGLEKRGKGEKPKATRSGTLYAFRG